MPQEYEYIKTEVNGETINIRIRKRSFSTFCVFDELQGIVGNNSGPRYSKNDSCYVPAKELLNKKQSGPVRTKKLTAPKHTRNK